MIGRSAGWVAVALAMLALVPMTACGGDDDSDGNGEPTEAPTTAGGGDELAVTLSEWSIKGEDDGELAAEAGPVTFEVENIGISPHELAVIRTDIDPAELPVTDLLVDEEEAGELIDRTSTMTGSAEETLTLDLEAGSYALICNIATHYEQGMFAALTVE